MNLKLSKNFSLAEACKSQTAQRHGISNLPECTEDGHQVIVSLTALAQKVLQPIRDTHGRTDINSGLRVPALNVIITGNPDSKSQHQFGEACDIECPSISNIELARWIQQNLEVDQGILEMWVKGDKIDKAPHYGRSGWIHVSYKANGENRNKWMTASRQDGKVVYEDGIQE